MPDQSSMFDAFYYENCCGSPYKRDEVWLNFFGSIAKNIKEKIHPNSVLDAGCAMGFLVECLRNEDINAYGVDISEYAIQSAYESIRPFVWVGSIVEPFRQRYDLIVSIEVLEHMTEADGLAAIGNFCQYSNDILFSSTPDDIKEKTHINVQPPEYWMEQFARFGFFRDLDFDASFITPWAVRLRKRINPLPTLIHDYEHNYWLMKVKNNDLSNLVNELRLQVSINASILEEKNKEKSNFLDLKSQNDVLKHQLSEYDLKWADLQEGVLWQLIQSIWRIRLWIFPRGTRREKGLVRFKINLKKLLGRSS
jgi:hypothetical protein